MRGVLAGIEAAGDLDFRRVRVLRRHLGGVDRRRAAGRRAAAAARRRGAADARERAVSGGPRRAAVGAGAAGRLALRAAGAAAAPLAPRRWRRGARPARSRGAAARARSRRRGGSLDGLRRARRPLRRALRRAPARRRRRPRDGRRVVFGAPGAPRGDGRRGGRRLVRGAVVFAPVTIGGREYVDGGVVEPRRNLDAAPAGRDTEVLCLDVTDARPSRRVAAGRAARAPAGDAVEALVAAPPRRARPHGRARRGAAARDRPEPHGPRAQPAGRCAAGYAAGAGARARAG